ncbi:hypothetical protein AcV7_005246 [Taiwanofungus camphoratus]|nr:hypothetical protein AcV7_005246 [Antrodia cinnamomea]KAI0929372.1 hypothetical protein AcV7_005246 [Antrodia cinnamomea]
MGYVRSRKFCCCLPVRFGVLCSAILGIAYGLAFTILGWLEVHRHATGKLGLTTEETVALVIFSLAYTFMFLLNIMGFIGAIGKIHSFVKGYAISLTVNTIITMAIGIYWCWKLFHTDKHACHTNEADTADKVEHWVCQKGFDAIRIVFVIILVIVWLFQIAGCAIVYDYVSQLDEQAASDEGDFGKSVGSSVTPYPAPPASDPVMRTTYDSISYDNRYGNGNDAQPDPVMKSAYNEQSEWAGQRGDLAAGKPYAFTTPDNSYGPKNSDYV